MSHPRQVLPGTTYLITRCCTQHLFLMRPDAATNNAFVYCLAVAAERHRIQVIATVAMSNHHHTVIHDPDGNYPAFIEYFHQLFARSQNALRGRSENFWESKQTNRVVLTDLDSVLREVVYCAANPVASALVADPREWPGINSYAASVAGQALRATRPTHFFRKKKGMPEEVTLELATPVMSGMLDEQWRELLRQGVQKRVKRLRREQINDRRKVMGARKVLAQKWSSSPRSPVADTGVTPQVAGKDRQRRTAALRAHRNFVQAYRAARELFLNGERDVLFPAGTYWLQRFAFVACVPIACIVPG